MSETKKRLELRMPLDLRALLELTARPRDLEFFVACRPISEANKREHWASRARRQAQIRMLFRMSANRKLAWDMYQAKDEGALRMRRALETLQPIACGMTLRVPRRFDSDNAQGAAKAARDGVAEALGRDDGVGATLHFLPVEQEIASEETGILVRFWSLEAT